MTCMNYSSPLQNKLSLMLSEQAKYYPNNTAIASPDGDVSMSELECIAKLHARNILKSVEPRQECIGLYAVSSSMMIAALWGIIFSEHAYLPLAPEYPDERIRYIVDHSGVSTIITQRHLERRLRNIVGAKVRILVIEEMTSSFEEPLKGASNTDLSYVIYTSGSTGRPKGVEITQDAIVHQMNWLKDQNHLSIGSRILQKTPISFDAAQWELLAPAVGATVVAGKPNLYRNIDALISSISAYEVSHLQCVPTLLANLVENDHFLKCQSLTNVFSGGESLSRKLAKKVLTRMNGVRFVNLYGPTECTINALSQEVTWDIIAEKTSRTVSIGSPVVGIKCHILDGELNQVPFDTEGELYISGTQLARGYRNAPIETSERFLSPAKLDGLRLYRTGDICAMNSNGTIQFIGRSDNQIKLRGYRVELEEIVTTIEEHPWVKSASVVVKQNQRSNGETLVACVELNEKEAALMDQGAGGQHHSSKVDKVQVKAQLAAQGVREFNFDNDQPEIKLPGLVASNQQRKSAFGRKTYRFYDGGYASKPDIEKLTAEWFSRLHDKISSRRPVNICAENFGPVMRMLGSFQSEHRLLPKYAYASPGALYATQLYLECVGLEWIPNGIYYYHPQRHSLIRVLHARNRLSGLRFHFVGNLPAIEKVYKINVLEVLEMEAGHMIGVLDENLATLGLAVRPDQRAFEIDVSNGRDNEYVHLGCFKLSHRSKRWVPKLELYGQAMPSTGNDHNFTPGTWEIKPESFTKISDTFINRRDVIAINQRVYDRAGIGFSVLSREENPRLAFIALGFGMHVFQRNSSDFGFMSSGYSSKSGHPTSVSNSFERILQQAHISPGPSYFFVGGKVSPDQIASEGMNEDIVHMQGPAEMIKEELGRILPDYMIPNEVAIFELLPRTASGKVDHKAVAASQQITKLLAPKPYVVPKTNNEKRLAKIWTRVLGGNKISRHDDFFGLGGDSLKAIAMLNQINIDFKINLPIQTVFETPRLTDLALQIEEAHRSQLQKSRLVLLNNNSAENSIFCWPGLGGYPMNLRLLAQENTRSFIGVQSYGLNENEVPYTSITEMAKADCIEIFKKQPNGPITLWGYSFGAKVAFEAAWQLEQAGRKIDQLVMLCPGNPKIASATQHIPGPRRAKISNLEFVNVLVSIFVGRIDPAISDACIREVDDFEGFVEFIQKHQKSLPSTIIRRIVEIARTTYEFEYNLSELSERKISAPVTIIKADGDTLSFLETLKSVCGKETSILNVAYDHYDALKNPAAKELSALIVRSTRTAATASLQKVQG